MSKREYLIPGAFWWLPACNDAGEAPEGNEYDLPEMLVVITKVDHQRRVLEYETIRSLQTGLNQSSGEMSMDPEYHSFKNMRVAGPEEVPPELRALRDTINATEDMLEIMEDGTTQSHNYTIHER